MKNTLLNLVIKIDKFIRYEKYINLELERIKNRLTELTDINNFKYFKRS